VSDILTELLERCRSRIERVVPADVPAALAAGAALIDIRTERQRTTGGVVPGSIWYPRNCLEWRCAPGSTHLDPFIAQCAGHVLLMCLHGYQTSLAAATLRDIGVDHAGEVIGGFTGWVAAGMPVEPYDADRHARQGSEQATFRAY
jgi:rhodanese-related sulfurtransferase